MVAESAASVGTLMTDLATGDRPDPFRHLDKQRSWNDFGSQYWELAASTSHPSALESTNFLDGAGRGRRVLVFGATTTELIRGAVASGAEVHVVDFAGKLLELVTQKFGEDVHVRQHDVLNPAPPDYAGTFDRVVADRLVNRFHRSEMPRVISNMMSFLAPEGDARISLRFGLYPLDHRLIAEGQRRGTLARFWDASTNTIDWSGVGDELDAAAEPHGEIPREVVIAWSRMRGVESRLDPAEVPQLVATAAQYGTSVRLRQMLDMDVAPDSLIHVLGHDE